MNTIKIKGKDYVLVKDRVAFFNENFPKGAIVTQLLSEPDSGQIVIKAMVFPEGVTAQKIDGETIYLGRYFVGHSQAKIGDGVVNKTAALENAETSAVGRALGMMGIGVIDSIASADEMKKATNSEAYDYGGYNSAGDNKPDF